MQTAVVEDGIYIDDTTSLGANTTALQQKQDFILAMS